MTATSHRVGVPPLGGGIGAVIVDDEPLARLRVRQLLDEIADVRVLAEFGDAAVAAAELGSLPVDLLFLDIEMPELSGFEVVQRLGLDVIPALVFVTAHAHYALEAFEAHALDYLVKPFTTARFMEVIDRARAVVAARGPTPGGHISGGERSDRPLTRIPIRAGARIRFLPVADVEWVEADGNYVQVHAAGRVHRIRRTLASLARALPRERFLRVHRSAIVSLDHVMELQPWSHGDYLVVMRDGAHVVASRTYSPALRSLLGLE